MADRFPSLDEFDAGHTSVHDLPASGDASSFLERERALLGDDADLFATPNDRKVTTVEEADDDLLGGAGEYRVPDASAEPLDFASSYPDIDSSAHQAPGGTITGGPTSSFAQSAYAAPPQEEPEVIKEWRAARDAEIAKRDALSDERRAATVAEARTAIDDFYNSYNDKRDKNVAQTRREADAFLDARDDTTAGGTSWERISKLVDLSGKGVRGGAAASGKERFRELLLSLKKDANAPGSSGV